jgi:hypothetical protein
MRQLMAFAVCMLACSPVFAQFPEVKPVPKLAFVKEKGKVTDVISYLPQKKSGFKKSAIGGKFTDARKQPIKGVRTFIYKPDSSIAGSGFTDVTGSYETNSVAPGKYNYKVVYPSSHTAAVITGVPVMAGYITEVSFLRSLPPATDTVIDYKEIAPKVEEKTKK